MEAGPAKRKPAAIFTDEILVEILRRLPVRSLCRFKCVSRSWRNLISDPRKKLPQTLAGFFYHDLNCERVPNWMRHFTNITGRGAPLLSHSLSFLPVHSDNVKLVDSCNGLLLCHCRCFGPCPDENNWNPPFRYVVCNPATKEWVMLPDGSGDDDRTVLLGFDPAVSSHFHVVEYVLDEDECVRGLEIYSSKTAAWSFKESEWDTDIMLHTCTTSVFLNGFIMLTFFDGVAVVDMEGKTWRTIPGPSDGVSNCIHQSQGRLFFLDVDDDDPSKLSIWVLEDHDSHEWTLKHSIRTQFLFGMKDLLFEFHYRVIAFHPECNLIYFVYGWHNILMAYEMDRKEVRIIRILGHEFSGPYLPYIPWFTEALPDGQ